MNRPGKTIVGATAGLVIFVGLPLLSVGPGSVGTFLDDPGRLAYLIVAALLTLVVAAAVPPSSRSRGVEEKVVHRQRAAVIMLQVLGLALIVVGPGPTATRSLCSPPRGLAWSVSSSSRSATS